MKFLGNVITGSGRGKKLNIPTINMNPADVPLDLSNGVYACKVFLDQDKPSAWVMGALHFGPRPVFKDSVSLEVHLIDQAVNNVPKQLSVEIIERLRDVRDFASPQELQREIAQDIERTRDILQRHAP